MHSTATIPCALPPTPSLWRDVIQPKEHGSWSLALEPVALGVCVAPSIAGLALSVAVVGGFLLRRPLKLAWRDPAPARRARAFKTVLAGSAVASAALIGAAAMSPVPLWLWLVPPAALGGVFLACDLSNSGRDALAEIAGSAAFACVAALFVVVAGGSVGTTLAIGLTMLARAVPTVWLVRLVVRSKKLGLAVPLSAIVPSIVAAVLSGCGAAHGFLPPLAAVAVGILLVRGLFYYTQTARSFRARTIGFCELAVGIAFVATASAAWLEPPQA